MKPGWQSVPHLSELTLGLLHKFNSLFTGVMFITEECVNAERAGESVEERLQEVLTTLREAHTYVDRIAKLHINEEEEEGYHDVDSAIASYVDLAKLLLPRGTVIEHKPGGERLTFYATQKAFRDILLHVVGNCGEALPKKRGGVVTISSRTDESHAGRVAVEIRDNGPGFADEIEPLLFGAACTSKDPARHVGLGLIQCRELARALGGELSAANHPDGGAVITLTLPQEAPDIDEEEEGAP